jgi:putative lipoprotein
MKRFLMIVCSTLASVGLLSACGETQEQLSVEVVKKQVEMVTVNSQQVTGTIYAKQPIAPTSGKGYLVKVILADISKMDVAATVIGSISFTTKHLPAQYSITFDPALVESRMSYALQTRITDESGQLVGVTDQHHKYTLTDPSIGFDILVKAIQLEAPIPIQIKMDCDEQNYSLARYPSLLVKTDLAVHNQHILPRVVSASGEHYQSSSESIFMKGDNPPLVEINGKRVSCHLEEKAMF